MSSCNGTGECLDQCYCTCFDADDDNEEDIICHCGHGDHDINYCPLICCVPVECRNYKYCNSAHPQWIIDIHNGICMNCAAQMGKHTFTNIIEDCCVCFEHKNMLMLECNHKICNNCWYNITKDKDYHDDSDEDEDDENEVQNLKRCPLCRHENQ